MKASSVFCGLMAVMCLSAVEAKAQLYRNPYNSPYNRNGGSWTDGTSDYNDTSNTYGEGSMGGGFIYSEKHNKTYECSRSGECYEAWDGI